METGFWGRIRPGIFILLATPPSYSLFREALAKPNEASSC
jgi:hypothetical protein